MRLPIRPLRKKWPQFIERRAARFFWADPQIILDKNVSADEFRSAMSAIHVGGTIKITGSNRHPEPDSLLINNVDLTDSNIVDIGASDGSTSVDLINRLTDFKSFTIADLHFTISASRRGRHTVFHDNDGSCILVVGNRLLAWPSQSKLVAALYFPLISWVHRKGGMAQEVLLLNPTARRLVAEDARVNYRSHNVFEPWAGQPPDVIKVANLLRRLYFTDSEILAALSTILDTLDEGGHLLMVDNPRIANMPPRGGLYKKLDGGFTVVAYTDNVPEIDDLIQSVTTAN